MLGECLMILLLKCVRLVCFKICIVTFFIERRGGGGGVDNCS